VIAFIRAGESRPLMLPRAARAAAASGADDSP
jgi:hypothetical protein